MISLWCLDTNRIQAQNQGLQLPGQTVYNWKSPADARAVMINQVTSLNQQMPGFTPGTTLYDNALRRAAFFKAIIAEIDRGQTVEESINGSMMAAATLGFSVEATYTSKIVLMALKEEARVMLTN
jgi:hypothetical protein